MIVRYNPLMCSLFIHLIGIEINVKIWYAVENPSVGDSSAATILQDTK